MLDSGQLAPWYEHVMLSTKPDVHNISQRRQRRTKPRTQATCAKIWWSSAVWFSSYASGQIKRHTHHNTSHAPLPGYKATITHRCHVNKEHDQTGKRKLRNNCYPVVVSSVISK